MKPVEDTFFYQAVMRICGNLNLQTMLADCYRFIRKTVPADGILMINYNLKTKTFEIFSSAIEINIGTELKFKLTQEVKVIIEKLEEDYPRHTNFILNRLQDHPAGKILWEAWEKPNISSLMSGLKVGNDKFAAVMLLAKGYKRYSEQDLNLFTMLNRPFAIALANGLQYQEVQRLKEMLADENSCLNRELNQLAGEVIIGQYTGLLDVMEMVRQVAPLKSNVMLLGETGVGKEMIANAIHYASPRAQGPFIKVNCGAIPESLIDSELFGHEKGAFTGAQKLRRGRFERANGGTIFLDEVGELPLWAQVRLLRVIQTREIERIGGTGPIPVNIRIISATHRNLEQMAENGEFRQDLWFRLNVFPILIPPLRKRKEDIPDFVHFFIKKKSQEMNLNSPKPATPKSIKKLQDYAWPGNVRELENVVERTLIRNAASTPDSPLIFNALSLPGKQSLGKPIVLSTPSSFQNMNMSIKQHIESALHLTGGKIQGKEGAAALLEMAPSTLRYRMDKLGIVYGRQLKKRGNE